MTDSVRKLCVGDTIEFFSHTNTRDHVASFRKRVTDIAYFQTFEKALEVLGVEHVLPTVDCRWRRSLHQVRVDRDSVTRWHRHDTDGPPLVTHTVINMLMHEVSRSPHGL